MKSLLSGTWLWSKKRSYAGRPGIRGKTVGALQGGRPHKLTNVAVMRVSHQ